jgi:plastocyanin
VLRRSLILALTVVASLGVVACGDDEDEGASAPPPATQTAEAEPDTGTAPGGGQRVPLQLAADPGGELSYDKDSLETGPGRVTIRLTNESQVPHNVVLERDGEDIGATETITQSRTERTFNLQTGEYTFYCSVGNHRQAGMEGTLTVE